MADQSELCCSCSIHAQYINISKNNVSKISISIFCTRKVLIPRISLTIWTWEKNSELRKISIYNFLTVFEFLSTWALIKAAFEPGLAWRHVSCDEDAFRIPALKLNLVIGSPLYREFPI